MQSSSSFQYSRHSVQQTGYSSNGVRGRGVGGIGGFTHIENRSVREQNDDSWIEVSSQPSDDTYSSASGHERASRGASRLSHRKKRLRRNEIFPGNSSTSASKAYDHHADDLSEAEMISSGSVSSLSGLSQSSEHESSSAAGEEYDSSENEVDEDEDTGTMLGIGQRAAGRASSSSSAAYAPYPGHSVHEFQRNLPNPSQSFLRHRNPHSGSSSLRSHPATKADHDEALMASLSTLLSCAAAARGLPKVAAQQSASAVSPGMGPVRTPALSGSRMQLDTLQLVPDQMMAEKTAASDEHRKLPGTPDNERTTRSRSASVTDTPPAHERSKSNNSKKRASPKPSAAVTPRQRSTSPRSRSRLTAALSSADASLLTIAFSAGAVILLSAISFSAGYAMGKEVGRTEAEAALGLMGQNAVKEVQRGGRGLVRGVSRGVVSVSA